MSAAYTLDQLLALIKRTRDLINALQTERPAALDTQLQLLRTEQTEYISQANTLLKPTGCILTMGELHSPKPLFYFHYNQPLENLEVSNIIGVEIISGICHFQVVDGEGKKGLRCTAQTPYVMDQIAQHNIPIEANHS